MARNYDVTHVTRRLPLSLSGQAGAARIRVKAGDNWLIPGRKGSGKTTFGKLLSNQLLQLIPTARLYVLDIKLRDFNEYPGIFQGDGVPPKPKQNDRVQVWQPIVINPEKVEEWLFHVRKDPPAILQIDELLALCYRKRDASDEFTKITKLGRALPITTLAQTQELVDIPRGAISQVDHVARFRLKHPYEKRFMDNIMGTDDLEEPQDPWGLWYSNAEKDGEPIYFPDAQTFLGLDRMSTRR